MMGIQTPPPAMREIDEQALQAANAKARALGKCEFTFHDSCAIRSIIDAYLSALPAEKDDWIIEEIKNIAEIKPNSHGHVEIAHALGKATGIAQGILEALKMEKISKSIRSKV